MIKKIFNLLVISTSCILAFSGATSVHASTSSNIPTAYTSPSDSLTSAKNDLVQNIISFNKKFYQGCDAHVNSRKTFWYCLLGGIGCGGVSYVVNSVAPGSILTYLPPSLLCGVIAYATKKTFEERIPYTAYTDLQDIARTYIEATPQDANPHKTISQAITDNLTYLNTMEKNTVYDGLTNIFKAKFSEENLKLQNTRS